MIKDFFNLIFPRCCLACERALIPQEPLLCTYCCSRLPFTNYHLEDDNPLMLRFYGKVKVAGVFSYLKFIKGGLTQKVLHRIKYDSYPELGQLLGKWFAGELVRAGKLPDIDLTVPVPLHKSRLKQRGYNQSDYIAKGFAMAAKIPHACGVLVRTSKSTSQARKKDRLERWQNVQDIFAVPQSGLVTGKHVLVVDDVLTTGATFEACALPLIQAGCRAISFATLAVTI